MACGAFERFGPTVFGIIGCPNVLAGDKFGACPIRLGYNKYTNRKSHIFAVSIPNSFNGHVPIQDISQYPTEKRLN